MRVQRVWTPPRSYSCHAVARARVAAVHRVAATDHRGVQLQIVSSVPVSRCSRSRTSSQDATPSAPISNACKHDNQLAPRRRARVTSPLVRSDSFISNSTWFLPNRCPWLKNAPGRYSTHPVGLNFTWILHFKEKMCKRVQNVHNNVYASSPLNISNY